jgi:hypothetical protein
MQTRKYRSRSIWRYLLIALSLAARSIFTGQNLYPCEPAAGGDPIDDGLS